MGENFDDNIFHDRKKDVRNLQLSISMVNGGPNTDKPRSPITYEIYATKILVYSEEGQRGRKVGRSWSIITERLSDERTMAERPSSGRYSFLKNRIKEIKFLPKCRT
jgi:hypothetical protein